MRKSIRFGLSIAAVAAASCASAGVIDAAKRKAASATGTWVAWGGVTRFHFSPDELARLGIRVARIEGASSRIEGEAGVRYEADAFPALDADGLEINHAGPAISGIGGGSLRHAGGLVLEFRDGTIDLRRFGSARPGPRPSATASTGARCITSSSSRRRRPRRARSRSSASRRPPSPSCPIHSPSSRREAAAPIRSSTMDSTDMRSSGSILRVRAALVFLAGLVAMCGHVRLAAAAEHWFDVARALAPSGTDAPLDFTAHATQPGLLYDIQAPEPACSACHGIAGGDPTTAPAFRPFTTWEGSMMANATRDPLFFAALDIANHDVPGVGDYCLRCHTPRGWLMGRVVKSGYGGPLNDIAQGAAACLLDGTYDEPDDNSSDMGGVTCHFCHRMMPNGPNGEPGYTDNGNAWVDDAACANTGGGPPCRRGPYAYTDGTVPPPHEWEYSEYHTESTICGTCHNVSSPDLQTFAPERVFVGSFDGALKTLKLNDGTETGHPFPIERTFAEWQQSQYAQEPQTTCQSCHMPETEDPDATACSLRINNRTGNMPVHAFVGGNTWVPGIISGEYGAGLDVTGNCSVDPPPDPLSCRTTSLAQTIDWARQQLGTAASVDTTITSYTPPTASAAGSMAAQVIVTNLTGHKLPTGYAEGRRMWINFQVHDADGALVFESGAYDSATAQLTIDGQARVYEVMQGIFNFNGTGACDVEDGGGAAMFHFILNDCIERDTRIPPLGFTPATAGDPNGYDLRPVGITYPETSPGSGVLVNFDTASYTLTVPAGTVGPLTATARLYYQTASSDYMAFLRNEATVNDFPAENDLCSAGPDRPFIVGPQDRSRGEYAYEVWNNASDDPVQPGYGKSPPELMQTGSATTSR